MHPLPHSALVIYCGASALYLSSAIWGWLPGWPGALVKALPALVLGAAFTRLRPGPRWPLLGVAAACCALGDAFLHLDRQRLFLFGLGSFLVAQLCYGLFFLSHRKPDRWAWTAPALAFVAVLSAVLVPRLGALTVPVLLYIAAITFMGTTAALAQGWAAVGALVFMASDGLIAWNKFVEPLAWSGPVILATYYVGNFGVALGALKTSSSGHQAQP